MTQRKQRSVTFSGDLADDVQRIKEYCTANKLSLPGTLAKLGIQFIESRGDLFNEENAKKDSRGDT